MPTVPHLLKKDRAAMNFIKLQQKWEFKQRLWAKKLGLDPPQYSKRINEGQSESFNLAQKKALILELELFMTDISNAIEGERKEVKIIEDAIK